MVFDPTLIDRCAVGLSSEELEACNEDTNTGGREGRCCKVWGGSMSWRDPTEQEMEAALKDIRDGATSDDVDKATAIFKNWWHQTAGADLDAMLPKRVAYGAADLRIIGRGMAELVGKPNMDDEEAVELGIAFYALGKVARIVSGFTTGGDRTDSWHDLSVYSMMARSVRDGIPL